LFFVNDKNVFPSQLLSEIKLVLWDTFCGTHFVGHILWDTFCGTHFPGVADSRLNLLMGLTLCFQENLKKKLSWKLPVIQTFQSIIQGSCC